MKLYNRFRTEKGRNIVKCLAGFLFIVLLTRCVYLDNVIQPGSVQAGDTLPVILKVRIEAATDASSRLIIGFLAPKGWNAGNNSTVTYTSSIGSGTMARVPAGTIAANGNGLEWPVALKAKYGIGGNLIDDLEWVVFWSDRVFAISNGNKISADVKIATKVGPENMLVKLGYFLGHTQDGVTSDTRHNKVSFSNCFSVTNGSGDLVDFCNPQLAFVDPAKATDNDIITLNFDGEVATTPLTGVSDVYLCAKAILTNGQEIEVCSQQEKSKLKAQGNNRFRLDFWPRQYFNLTDEQTIAKLEYFFSNQDGSIKVGYGGTSSPFNYTFRCN